ncbi:MAG: VOC family protein [Burkholderiales bacterium]
MSGAPQLSAQLDHVGAMVRNLATGVARWEALGFTLTPESRQRGKLPDRDDEGPWATANRCAVFRQGYLELIGIVDKTAFNPWTRFMDRFEGIHLVALRVSNADAAYAELAARVAKVHPTVQRERKVMIDGIEASMRFRNVFSRDEAYPEGRYIVIEHQTPELLWQPAYTTHPNGAVALESTVVVAKDVAGQCGRLRTLLGGAVADVVGDGKVFSAAGGGAIEVMTPETFTERYGEAPSAEPAYAAVTIRFAERSRAVMHMLKQGVTVNRRGGRTFLDAATTGGFVMELVGNQVESEGVAKCAQQ